MRISRWIVMASLAAVASAARGTDVDLRIGTRSFDVERWPEVGVAVAVGPDDRWVRPAFGAAVAFDFLYGGTVLEASAGLAGDLPHRGRVAFGWGLGAALLAYDYGPNHGTQAAGYAELGARWVRPDGVDLGLNLRYLDGSDVELRAEGSTGESFCESLETVVVSFVLRW